ncbi:glycosyltransferase [Adlercreutzia sp. ZJ154]|uniref:glycosyltransferase family 2 protein n=1 Tax=Adlercreutzia sp. ZJ154 TaxID=2709790 RepID=UPI001980A2B3|nr:glycosyltransferase [Adlercreutzia sp. ZJ154]
MSKIDTAKKLFKLSVKNPKSYIKTISYALKYGLHGVRSRFHEELVLEESNMAMKDIKPSSVKGKMLISVVIPTYNVEIKWIEKAIESVESQSYENWELCIVDDASESEMLKDYLQSKQGNKIKVLLLSSNVGISNASNEAIALANGEYIVMLDHDDVLFPTALEEIYACASTTHADIVYSDHDVIDAEGNRLSVLYKPDWSPDLVLSQMYIGHLLAFKKSLFEEVGGFDSRFDGSQDYDLFLKMSAKANCIEHIPQVLYSWRSLPTSTATNPQAKPYAQTAGLDAVQSHLDRVLGNGVANVEETDNLFVYDVRYPIPENTKASIIIPIKDKISDLSMLIQSIDNAKTNVDFEIIILNNNSVEPATNIYLNELLSHRDKTKVVDAKYEFNWSRLNNDGVVNANGNVFVFMNNDMVVLSDYWLDRLVENALRPDIGAVGGLLLYPDGTIQHAGVVIGMNGWADHVFKGMQPIHFGSPFISPVVQRNVSAVTGACMAISKETFEMLGGFNEDFLVCGSDVEICLKAEKHGLRNLYLPQVRLEHHESKTRDPEDIPEIDFVLSEQMYRIYRMTGDPYYNVNLNINSYIPKELSYRERVRQQISERLHITIPEIDNIAFAYDGNSNESAVRLTLCLPSINQEDIYGGISTALKFFNDLKSRLGTDSRILVFDTEPRESDVDISFPEYEIVKLGGSSNAKNQIINAVGRSTEQLEVSNKDWFIATAWWTAYCIQESMSLCMQQNPNAKFNPLLYLIQDYEPGFYSWSSEYLLADATYKNQNPTIAIFNSIQLRDYFDKNGYSFAKEYTFEPFLNPVLKARLLEHEGTVSKKRQILVYGRPETDRNAFSLIIEALRKWIDIYNQSSMWDIVSAGENHLPVPLGKGRYLVSVGKLSLDMYANVLSESYAGISLMVSPHPSYPPLEMASFGVEVITNNYSVKNLSSFGKSIHSLDVATPAAIAGKLQEICDTYELEKPCGEVLESYIDNENMFPFIDDLVQVIRE